MAEQTIESQKPLRFPNICVSCGEKTSRVFHVNIKKTVNCKSLIFMTIPFGHLIAALDSLSNSSVEIKLCSKCDQTLFFYGLSSIMAGLGLLLFTTPLLVERFPEILGVISIAIGLFLLLSALLPYVIGKEKSANLSVTVESGNYVYAFKSKIAFDKVRKSIEAAENRSNREVI